MTDLEKVLSIVMALIAIYGAVVSTVLFCRDRTAIKVEVTLGFAFSLGSTQDFLIIKALNVGRRKVNLNSHPTLLYGKGMQLYYKGQIFLDQSNPSIDEGECYEFYFPFDAIRDAYQDKDFSIPFAARFKDAIGHEYLYKFKRGEWKNYEKHFFSK